MRPSILTTPALLIVGALASGCAIGQTVAFHNVVANPTVSGPGRVEVATRDQRPAVTAGERAANYVGVLRSIAGVPWPVRTATKRSLAEEMAAALVSSLQRRGFWAAAITIADSAGATDVRAGRERADADRLVILVLREWASDTWLRTDLSFDVSLSVIDPTGRILAETRVSGREKFAGGPWTAIPAAFRAKLEAMLSDPEVTRALIATPLPPSPR